MASSYRVPVPTGTGLVFDGNDALGTMNKCAAAQGAVDKKATDETKTVKWRKQVQDEHAEHCHAVLNDLKDAPVHHVKRIHHFLCCHACRPKMELKNRGLSQEKTDTKTIHTQSEKCPKWFDHKNGRRGP